MRLAYSDRARTQTERTVDPLGLVEKGSVWYSSPARRRACARSGSSRMQSVEVTDEPVERPPDFDLAATWQEVVATIEERRTTVRATVRMEPSRYRAAGPVRDRFTLGDELADGRFEVEIGARYPNMVAEQLAGWGDLVEVISPPEVRAVLAQSAANSSAATREGRDDLDLAPHPEVVVAREVAGHLDRPWIVEGVARDALLVRADRELARLGRMVASVPF